MPEVQPLVQPPIFQGGGEKWPRRPMVLLPAYDNREPKHTLEHLTESKRPDVDTRQILSSLLTFSAPVVRLNPSKVSPKSSGKKPKSAKLILVSQSTQSTNARHGSKNKRVKKSKSENTHQSDVTLNNSKKVVLNRKQNIQPRITPSDSSGISRLSSTVASSDSTQSNNSQSSPSSSPYPSPYGDLIRFLGSAISLRQSTKMLTGPIPRPYTRTFGARIGNLDTQNLSNWRSWLEVGVRFSGLPPNTTTRDVWEAFRKEGQIATIELFEDNSGSRDGRGRARFSPPPKRPFWESGKYPVHIEAISISVETNISLDPRRRTFLAPSPVNPQIKYPECTTILAHCVDFGIMYEPTTMMGMHRVVPMEDSQISFRLNLLRREIDISFQLEFLDPRRENPPEPGSKKAAEIGKLDRFETLRFRIPFAQPLVVYDVGTFMQPVLLISMETPPNFFRKFDELHTHEPTASYWNNMDAWYRQTDLLYNRKRLRLETLTLRKSKPVIDIGRWTTFRFEFDIRNGNRSLYNTTCKALKDFNVEITPLKGFKLIINREPAVWSYIDKPISKDERASRSALEDLTDDSVPQLSFPVRYQLEVCISQGYLNEHNLTKIFIDRLMSMDEAEAQDLLEYIANQKKRLYRPMEIFDIKIISGSSSRYKIPHYCAYTRSATVTPSTIYYNTPSVDTSNRVIRQYAEYGDRFLRVRFTDEKFQGRINSTDKETMNEVFTRIKRAMNNGITIGDRRFEFLAFGNSQFREHGAYFFAPVEHLGPRQIRNWMGDFQEIKVIAKHAARLGQCFSTTRAIHGAKKLVEIEDVFHGKYCFTDGVGRISKFLAQMTASELSLTAPDGDSPSVFQFRLGGCKGVLAVSPDIGASEIHLRKSQYKFPASHTGLEIIRWSQFASAYLNRQLIVVLSTLNVPDTIFIKKLTDQLTGLEQAMVDEKIALSLLQKAVDPNHMTLTLASMVLDGFQHVQEPFMKSLLRLWRAWSIKYLKEKAKIPVSNGALLLGCVDETAILQGHFDHKQPRPGATVQERLDSLPQVFVQTSKGQNSQAEIITGPMLLARNPSLHPGDIRIVYGVDVPALRHLKECVVLPQTGDRDISSMCSGGDLDGDDYIIMWDKDLLPLEWNHPPMDYEAPKAVEAIADVTTNDLTSFFVTYMKNDNLPSIAHAHLATADYMDGGVKNEKCIRLADLHSQAVDYVKTGVPALMPHDLRPRKWPHFMEKNYKPKEQIYNSKKVLGQLYDQVERVDFAPEFETPFDERILNAYERDEKMMADAVEIKDQYDMAMRRIMAQHDIQTEFEVWTTFVMHHANQSKDFKFHEEMGEISCGLKDRYRALCYEKAGGKDFYQLAPFVTAMYRVTQEQITQGLAEYREHTVSMGEERRVREMTAKDMPLMSFPWLFHSVLGKIATGEIRPSGGKISTAAPVQEEVKKALSKKPRPDWKVQAGDILETTEGITHPGELLELFHHDGGEAATSPKNVGTPKASAAQMGQPENRPTTSERRGMSSHPTVPKSVVKSEARTGMLIDFGFDDNDNDSQSQLSSEPTSTSEEKEEGLDVRTSVLDRLAGLMNE